jgi:hypothetical protein
MKHALLVAVACSGALIGDSCPACSVPVFRYALERWIADPYQVAVFHRGPLAAAEQALVEKLTPKGPAGTPIGNVNVQTVDLDDDPPAVLLDYWEKHGSETLPAIVVHYPLKTGLRGAVWSGPLTEENAARITDSPCRREISGRLTKGETAVWVLLEGGDKSQDDAAFQQLEERLRMLQGKLKLPEIEQQDVISGLVSVDPAELKLAFSAVRLSRDDPAEQVFVEMLLGSEEDLRDAEFAGQAMAFPVFGRGRALYALVGAGINDELIERGCRELIGPCTCQVKEQNPGVDLLMAVDWDNLVQVKTADKPAPPLAGLASFAPAENAGREWQTSAPRDSTVSQAAAEPHAAAAVVESHGDNPATGRSAANEFWRRSPMWAVLGLGLLAVFAVGLLMMPRKNSP